MKKENIIEAAVKRFSHFGTHKTTLAEIADDLGISKPSLFYYFPDKQCLVTAVEEKIIAEYLETLEKRFAACATVEKALGAMLEVRMQFLEKYFMLADQLESSETTISQKPFAGIKSKLKEKEAALLVNLFEGGVQKKELKPMNPVKTGGLLLETLSALAHCVREKRIVPDHKFFVEVFAKQKDIMQIFYNGLKQ